MEDSTRIILAAPRARDRTSVALVLVLILPMLTPFMAVEAAQVRAEDFGIVAELHDGILEVRPIFDTHTLRKTSRRHLGHNHLNEQNIEFLG